ncbi:GNAT family N-acetyltransferase [Hoeflea poritis]|uniref:GNAT family protein n=1 Tax=Hoeflea poritis TaxID=2993659 RepID=A0ABT4VMK9_9HYPH|nr:GNAT family protein [Hoeflea poritis]MDA4845957.1 GNAT family protein [Hoeflea poritis]
MEARIPGMRFYDDAQCIGHERDGALVGAVGYDHFSHNACMVHLASDGTRRWLTRKFIRLAMAYPFNQLGCSRITCLVSSKNTESLRFTRHFGWIEEGRMRRASPDGGDFVVFGMLREECRYLPGAGFWLSKAV